MTQIQSTISSLILHVHKNRFHTLLAKCLLYQNPKLLIAKHSVMLLLLYIIYNHYRPESQGSHSTAQPLASRLSVEVISLDRLGRPTSCARRTCDRVDRRAVLLAHRRATRAALLMGFAVTLARTDAATAASILSTGTGQTSKCGDAE